MTKGNAGIMKQHKVDVLIVGAGPVGLFSVFACGMQKLRCQVVDSLEMIGGQCNALYPEKPIYDIPAYPRITGADLIEKLQAQIAPFHPVFHLGNQIQQLHFYEGRWQAKTNKNLVINASAVIVAAGVGAFGPNRPPLANIEEYEGKSVFYHVRQPSQFAGKTIVIAGGGDSALDWAINLSPLTAKTYLIHRRQKFRAAPASLEKLEDLVKKGKIEVVVPYQLHELKGKNGFLTEMVLQDLDGHQKSLKADALLAFFGLSNQLGPIADWGLSLDHHHIKINPEHCATNQLGIYAVGDIAAYPGKLKLILSGFSEAASAAHAIRAYLRPDEVVHFEYSTTSGVNPLS